MLLSAVSVLVVAQSSSEIPEGLMNNPVLLTVPSYLHARMNVSENKATRRIFKLLEEVRVIGEWR